MIFSSESAVHGFVHFPVEMFVFFSSFLFLKIYFYVFSFGTWTLLC